MPTTWCRSIPRFIKRVPPAMISPLAMQAGRPRIRDGFPVRQLFVHQHHTNQTLQGSCRRDWSPNDGAEVRRVQDEVPKGRHRHRHRQPRKERRPKDGCHVLQRSGCVVAWLRGCVVSVCKCTCVGGMATVGLHRGIKGDKKCVHLQHPNIPRQGTSERGKGASPGKPGAPSCCVRPARRRGRRGTASSPAAPASHPAALQ